MGFAGFIFIGAAALSAAAEVLNPRIQIPPDLFIVCFIIAHAAYALLAGAIIWLIVHNAHRKVGFPQAVSPESAGTGT